MLFGKIIKKLANKFNVDLLMFAEDYTKEDSEIMDYVIGYTGTTNPEIKSLIESTKYIIQNNISGSFVECGVWRGGSTMVMIRTLQQLGVDDREVFLFDTFEGMTKPTKHDVRISGSVASDLYEHDQLGNSVVSLNTVKKNVLQTNYNEKLISFIKGSVENTIPEHSPDVIALLRLDTDWYESTKHELENLFPLLSTGGIILIDDYGLWKGAKKATDEYFAKNNIRIFLNRVHPSGAVIGVKQ